MLSMIVGCNYISCDNKFDFEYSCTIAYYVNYVIRI